MGSFFSKDKKAHHDDTVHTLFEHTQLENTLDLFQYGENGGIVICQAAAEVLDDELGKLIAELPSDSPISSGKIKTLLVELQQLIADRLKKPENKEQQDVSARCGIGDSYRRQKTSETQTGSTGIKTCEIRTQTVSIETHRVGAVLQVMKNMPASAKTINAWVRAMQQNKVLNQQMLREFSGALMLDANIDDSITLSQSDKDTILQNITDYLRCVDERNKHIQRDANIHDTEAMTPKHTKEMADKHFIETDETYERRKLNIKVQIVDPLPSKANEMFYESLKRWMEPQGIELIKLHTTALSDLLSGSNYIIVICNNMSRLIANVSNTLANANGANCRRIFLIVLHCQKEAYLPRTLSKSELLKSGDFKDLPEAVDFAFNTDAGLNGIYDCEMNKRAFETFNQFIRNGKLVVDVKE